MGGAMSSLVVSGDTSGSVTLSAPAVAGSTTITLPSTSGTLALDIPSGVMLPYAAAAAPTGWLLCYGQAVSRTTYAALFTAISTTFGVGDGSTTFNLPDMRGRVAAGVDNMGGSTAGRVTNAVSGFVGTTLGAAGGLESHTLITAEMPSHTHAQAATTILDGGATLIISNSGDRGVVEGGTTGSAGSGSAHRNMQPTMMLTYIIKV